MPLLANSDYYPLPTKIEAPQSISAHLNAAHVNCVRTIGNYVSNCCHITNCGRHYCLAVAVQVEQT